MAEQMKSCSDAAACNMPNVHCAYPDCLWGRAKQRKAWDDAKIQACRPEDRAMLATDAGQELVKAAVMEMDKSETPRTDDAEDRECNEYTGWKDQFSVSADFARQLERELSIALAAGRKDAQDVVPAALIAARERIEGEDWIGTCGCQAGRKGKFPLETKREWCSCYREHMEILDKIDAAIAAPDSGQEGEG